MSFVIEPSVSTYRPNKTVDSSLLPPNYLTYENESAAFFKTVAPWYQPGGEENQALLHTYGITTNQQYRKYMTSHSESVQKFNTQAFQSTTK